MDFQPFEGETKQEGLKEKALLLLKTPRVIISLIVVFVLLLLFFSINDLMKALLHSRTEVVVPDLEGQNLMDALGSVSQLDLALQQEGTEFDESLPAGTVVRQHPPSGMKVRAGRPIRVVVSKGGQVVFVPLVGGKPLAEAKSLLALEGLQVGTISEIFSDEVKEEMVISHEPSSGTVVTKGALVDIVLSKGPPPAESILVPDFLGQPLSVVRDWAEARGVEVQVKESVGAVGRSGTVVRQRPIGEQPLLEKETLKITIVPLLASKQGYRFSYTIPREYGRVELRIVARDNRGEFEAYRGTHKGGEVVEVPMAVEATTRLRIYLDNLLEAEQVIEP